MFDEEEETKQSSKQYEVAESDQMDKENMGNSVNFDSSLANEDDVSLVEGSDIPDI